MVRRSGSSTSCEVRPIPPGTMSVSRVMSPLASNGTTTVRPVIPVRTGRGGSSSRWSSARNAPLPLRAISKVRLRPRIRGATLQARHVMRRDHRDRERIGVMQQVLLGDLPSLFCVDGFVHRQHRSLGFTAATGVNATPEPVPEQIAHSREARVAGNAESASWLRKPRPRCAGVARYRDPTENHA